MEPKFYKIGDKKFIQSELVLNQVEQLGQLFKDKIKPEEFNLSFDYLKELLFTSGLTSKFFAIVLVEEGSSIRNRDIDEQADFFGEKLTVSVIGEALADFFALNDIQKIVKSLDIGKIAKSLLETIRTISTGLTLPQS